MAVTKSSDFDDEKSTTKIYLVENLRKFTIGGIRRGGEMIAYLRRIGDSRDGEIRQRID